MQAASTAGMWLGPVGSEARSGYQRAREAGLSTLRALVVGNIASRKEVWAFRSTIARHVGCSVRTVQRAITQAKEAGLVGTARAKQGEIPPGAKSPIPCGWSHRWVIGWGKAGAAVKDAVNAARARWMVKQAFTSAPKSAAPATDPRKPRTYTTGRRMTAEEIDRELAVHDAVGTAPWRAEKPPPS